MAWTDQFDGYCERVDFTYWSEPVNAVTNAAFIVAALIMWSRTSGMPLARLLCAILFAIGVGSYLFHTHATQWAATADVVPIALFILTYIFAMNRDVWRWPLWLAVGGALAFIPYAIILTPVFAALPFFDVSAFYWPVPLLILIYAVLLRHRYTYTAQGLAIGAGILIISLTFRTIDEWLCSAFPMGTHFMWHILNGLMLGWMIEVYRRHLLAGGMRGR
jgi:hypothetical protein